MGNKGQVGDLRKLLLSKSRRVADGNPILTERTAGNIFPGR